ncbi:stalk domain-containing protein [Paenibacillus sacheonensis]|uniref:PQQ-binding-like beta-propeller repeat protein n=1 Tax=Paenibacillus sacheonensis TaxID=742054 RepID=A0A7X4YRG3_9BACL|nr:stalk domain-containing protein [Paenibacillus sacheonensis]MBM7563533.1 outer membrane protein assembly factor BamB [Paenibacillus sacheonensis]NBC71168.1 PQQ-binding-like beta-propeller repeat protein [Paenibacillus sacheonensis]
MTTDRRRTGFALLLCLMVLLLSVVVDGGQEKAYAVSSASDSDIQQVWKTTVKGRALTPIVSHGFIYVISRELSGSGWRNGVLYALNRNGEIVWQYKLADASEESAAIDVNGDYVYVADGELKALDAKTGELAWSFLPAGDTLRGVPTVHEDRIYMTSDVTHAVYAVDRKGALIWKEQVRSAGKLSPVAFSPDGTMVVASSVQTDEGDVSDPLAERYSDQSGTVHARVYSSTLYAYDKEGFALWQTNLDGIEPQSAAPVAFPGGYAVGRDALYILDAKGKILHAPTSRMSWNFGEPAAAGNKIYYPTDNKILGFDANGEQISSYGIPSPFGHAVSDAYGRLLIWQENGWLAMMNDDGSLRILYKPVTERNWSHANASVALGEDGTIYTAYMDGADNGDDISHILALKDRSRPSNLPVVDDAAPTEVTVRINGKLLHLESDPMVVRGNVYLPMRELFDALGAKVTYDAKGKLITATRGNMALVYRIGDLTAKVNGQTSTLNAPGKIVQGRTMVPLRFVSQSFGFKVEWSAKDKSVRIDT